MQHLPLDRPADGSQLDYQGYDVRSQIDQRAYILRYLATSRALGCELLSRLSMLIQRRTGGDWPKVPLATGVDGCLRGAARRSELHMQAKGPYGHGSAIAVVGGISDVLVVGGQLRPRNQPEAVVSLDCLLRTGVR